MFGSKQKLDELNNMNVELLWKNKQLETQLAIYKKANDEARTSFEQYQKDQKEKEKEQNKCQCVLNFSLMQVISIERIYEGSSNRWKTIVGYYNEGNLNVREWYLYITSDQHEKLCKEFKEHMSSKKRGVVR